MFFILAIGYWQLAMGRLLYALRLYSNILMSLCDEMFFCFFLWASFGVPSEMVAYRFGMNPS